jgi:hypothetical protein
MYFKSVEEVFFFIHIRIRTKYQSYRLWYFSLVYILCSLCQKNKVAGSIPDVVIVIFQ